MVTALSTEWVAVVLGVIAGIGIALPTLLSTRFLRSSRPEYATYFAMGSVFGGMLVAVLLMLLYRYVAEEGFTFFALSLVGGFVVCVGIGAARMAHRMYITPETEK